MWSRVFPTLLTLCASTDVNVMLGLDTLGSDGHLKDPSGLGSQLDQLKSANVDGIMVDVWWGLTEPQSKSYNFDAYKQIVKMAKDRGMKVQFVASFHQCGGNVGDACNIPLPSFVTSADGIWYKDHDGNEDKEYISLFADNVSVADRPIVQMYADWFKALASAFQGDLGSTINEIQVGMGPAGELRYPSYQLSHWSFCGVGAFQCFDEHAVLSFQNAAAAAGHAEWNSPPTDAGDYNSKPGDVSFFQNGYTSEYGRFFLDWYFGSLKGHASQVLGAAREAFGSSLALAGKVSGVHWWYKSPSHAAEVTAGYINTNGRDPYAEIADVFAATAGASVDFTCMEMKDSEQDQSCASGPQELVRQVASAAKSHGLKLNGENALPRYDADAFGQIESYRNDLGSFTYLRLCSDLLQGDNFNNFKNFVNNMHGGAAVVV